MKRSTDALITGGGLAGLGLAYQLKKQRPDIDITVVEKRQFPVPRAIAKVGESTVEIGSRYLSKHLDLSEHLKNEQLKKFGIRMFFGEPLADFSQQDELGASQVFGIPTYQIDRGDIENHLAERVRSMGVRLVDAADISELQIGQRQHQLRVKNCDEDCSYQAKWLVDASGRHALIKNTLDLSQQNEHKGHAVWFRIDRHIEIDDWSQNPQWHERCQPQGKRWLSTNHLVGPGYWVWIIPLASGVTSIGIVMDEQAFAASGICDQNSTIAWIEKNQARCAKAIAGATFLDFVLLKDYSYSCKKIMDDAQWGITGEAALFADPLYSPGSDFIAINNNFLCDLIASSSRGEDTRFKRALYEKIYFSIYQNTLSLYTGQYGGFGDRQMMGLKLLWDYSYYWGVLSLLFFRGALHQIDSIRKLAPQLMQSQTLNQQVQAAFRLRASQRKVFSAQGIFMDQYKVPCLQHFNRVLMNENADSIEADLKDNSALLQRIAASVLDMLGDEPGRTSSADERDLLGDYRRLILA